jgi:hypothetical protein
MDELLTEELAVRRLQEKMDDAFRAAMQRTINAGEETTPTVVSKNPALEIRRLSRLSPTRTGACDRAPVACAVPVIRWGVSVSSDKLRQSARCTACGHKGATIQHPGWVVNISASCRSRPSASSE